MLNTVLVDNLVSGEESKSVGVVLERLNDTEDLGVVVLVVGLPRSSAVDITGVQRRVDVKDHVDTSGIEDGDTLVVVELRRQVVNTDGVHLNCDEIRAIPSANKAECDRLHPVAA